MKRKNLHPAIVAIVSSQEKMDAKKVSIYHKISPENINSIVSELEIKFDIILSNVYEDGMTVGDLAQKISKTCRYNRLCKEMQNFALKIYDLKVSPEQIVETAADKSKLKRVASCYILKERVPRRERGKRRFILQSQSIKQIVERIIC